MNYIDIGNDQDRRTIAGILVMNNYTVRIAIIKSGNSKKGKRVLAFEKNLKEKEDEQGIFDR